VASLWPKPKIVIVALAISVALWTRCLAKPPVNADPRMVPFLKASKPKMAVDVVARRIAGKFA
jgi:hypothetical protein